MAHYDSYSKEELIRRIESLEKNERTNTAYIKQLHEDYAALDSINMKQTRVILRNGRTMAEQKLEIERLDNLLAKYLVADALGKTG